MQLSMALLHHWSQYELPSQFIWELAFHYFHSMCGCGLHRLLSGVEILTDHDHSYFHIFRCLFGYLYRGVSGVYDPSECPLPSLSQQIGYNFTIISPVISGLISLSLELTATVTTYSDINRQHPQNAFMNGPIYFFVDLTSPLPLTSSSFISIGYRQFGTTELLTYLLNLNSQVTTLGLNVNLITSYPQSNGTTAVFSITYNGNRSIAFDPNSQLFDPLVYSVYNMELVIELDVSYSTVFSKKTQIKRFAGNGYHRNHVCEIQRHPRALSLHHHP